MASPLATVEVVRGAGPAEQRLAVVVASTSRELPVLQASPIPAGWILEGAPEARAIELTSGQKGQCSSGLWACSAGRFQWYYGSDEIVRILNGEVHLRLGSQHQIARAGDVVAFRGGTVVEWTVPEYVEKFWVLAPAPTLTTRLRRRLRQLVRH